MRSFISTRDGSVKLNGASLRAIAILGSLKKANRPLRVKSIIDLMLEFGVLSLSAAKEENEVSGILQTLMEAGAVYHPEIPAGSRFYCLKNPIDIKVEL